ncbi:carboxypeptidase regulatory-like domain-containing protein [Methanooceanicella nereidis]
MSIMVKDRRRLFDDERGVEGLPVHLIVVLVVGVVALAAMVSAINGFKPQKTLTASVISVNSKDGNLLRVSSSGAGVVEKTWSCVVKVTDGDGAPVSGASVILHGLSGAGSDDTDKSGIAKINNTNAIKLNANQNSGYLTMEITAPGFYNYKNENALAVIRVD